MHHCFSASKKQCLIASHERLALAKLGKKKHTVIISEQLDRKIQTYIKERAIEIISKGGKIPSESQLIEELLAAGLRTMEGTRHEG
jgi:hypothetical protein